MDTSSAARPFTSEPGRWSWHGKEPAGPRALIGAGTGLGEAVAVRGACGRAEVLATEGGHASFAPRDETEMEILRFLLRRYDHVSWERVVSVRTLRSQWFWCMGNGNGNGIGIGNGICQSRTTNARRSGPKA